jgi:hypothetical protein
MLNIILLRQPQRIITYTNTTKLNHHLHFRPRYYLTTTTNNYYYYGLIKSFPNNIIRINNNNNNNHHYPFITTIKLFSSTTTNPTSSNPNPNNPNPNATSTTSHHHHETIISNSNSSSNNNQQNKTVRVSPHLVDKSTILPSRWSIFKSFIFTTIKHIINIPNYSINAIQWLGKKTWLVITNPRILIDWSRYAWDVTKHEAKHYATGFKTFWVESKTSYRLFTKRLQGEELTRRERLQLARSFSDIGRLGPFMVFVIVPFMEFTLPFFLKVFPNMLPSPFVHEVQIKKNRMSIGQVRTEMASYMQEMVANMESNLRQRGTLEDVKTIEALVDFVEKTRHHQPLDNKSLPHLIKTFSDELTLDRMSREQLLMMCKYMGITQIGSDAYLRYSLKARLKAIRADDQSIAWGGEGGLDGLTLDELKDAALERGMLAESDDPEYYRTQLKRWIELSVNENVSPTMLILSRAFAVIGPQEIQDDGTVLPSKKVEAVLNKLEAVESDIVSDALLSTLQKSTTTKSSKIPKSTLAKAKLVAVEAENEVIREEKLEQEELNSKKNVLTTGSSNMDSSNSAPNNSLKKNTKNDVPPSLP